MGGDLTVNSIPTDGHLTKIFCPGAGDLPFDKIRHAISVRSLEPRIEKTGSPETFIFISASAYVFSGLLEFEYSTQSGFWG
jgi:hypothetical protein